MAQWLADSAGKGILLSFVCHSVGQLAERYGQHAADAIWSLAGTKLFLPGISDPDTLRAVSDLCGTTGTGDSERRVCPPELLRTLPDNRALVISMNRRPLVIKFRPIWKRIAFRLGRNPAPPRSRAVGQWMTPDWAELEDQLRQTAPVFQDAAPSPAWPGVISARPSGWAEGDDDEFAG